MKRVLARAGYLCCLSFWLAAGAPAAGSPAAGAPAAGVPKATSTGTQSLTATLSRAMAEAERALGEGELEIAESRLRTVLLEGWLLRGRLDLATDGDGMDRLEAAEQAFRKASISAVANRRALTRLALVKLRRGETPAAIALLRDLVSRDPVDGRARRLLAQALVSAEQTAAAVQELEEGHAAAPEDVETTFALATGYLRLGKVDLAEKLFGEVAATRPGPQVHVLIGRTYRDFEHYDRARQSLEEALRLDPKVRRAGYYLGTVVLLELGMDGLEQAIDRFERELELAPEDPMTHLYLGSALAESRRFEQAIPLLERAARWPPTEFDAERYLGRSLAGLGRHAEAAAVLRGVLAKGGSASGRDLSEIHYQLAIALRQLGEAGAAKEHFAIAKRLGIDLAAQHRQEFSSFLRDDLGRTRSGTHAGSEAVDPFDVDGGALDTLGADALEGLRRGTENLLARAYMNLGVLQAQAEDFGRAAELFEQAATLDPRLPEVQRSLGMARFRAGHYDRATEPLRLALGAAPGSGDLRRALAVSYLNVESYDLTAELLRDDPERNSSPAVQFTYAVALVRSGRVEQAAPIFDQLLAADNAWPALHVLVGQAKAQEGDFEAAEASLRHALSLDPQVAEAQSTLGDLFMRQGRLDEAEQALHAELASHPGDLRARYLLATVLDLHRKPAAARQQLQAILDDRPGHSGARYLLGKILLAGGDPASAVEQLEAAAEIAPNDANVHYQLGLAYQRSGDGEAAKRHFAIFRRLKSEARESPS